MNNTAIVIGSGIGGIAAALRLAARNYSVKVFEKNPYLGGKMAEIRQNGYRFDAGPSLFTLPSAVEALYELFGEKASDSFAYKQLDVLCKYFYEDGTVVNAYSDHEKLAKELHEKNGEKESSLHQFLKHSRNLYEITSDVFIFKSVHKMSSYMSKGFLKSGLRFGSIDAFKTMHQANEKFFDNPKTVQLFDRYATYNGSDPYQAPGTINVISHLEHNVGAFFPEKGMRDIINSLVELGKRHGVEFITEAPVEAVVEKSGKIQGVKVNGQLHEAGIVVSDIDIYKLYDMLKKHKVPKQQLKQERSSSALIFYWGMKKEFPGLDLHNIFFSEDYETEFDYIFRKKDVYRDPTVYVFISKKHIAGDAPEGCENWFVMVNVPENVGQNWDNLTAIARQNIQKKLSRMLQTDIAELIDFEEVLTPVGIEERTASFRGSIYGNSSNSKFAAFNRHPNFKNRLDGLYFVGGSVHPGGGIPLCISSAAIVDEILDSQQ